MRLTIDNLNGAGETDYTALVDSAALPKIVRKLNQPPVLTAWLAGKASSVVAAAGSKVRLYQDSGALWFVGYLVDAPQMSFAGVAAGTPVFRILLNAKGEMTALDRAVLSEHWAMGGYTAGQAVQSMTAEANAGYNVSGVESVCGAGTITVETGEIWSEAAVPVADAARAVLTVQNRAVTLAPVGAVTRTLSDGAAGFLPEALKLVVSPPAANDVTVVGGTEPAMYWCDSFTATGTERTFDLSETAYKPKTAIVVDDDFDESSLDATKWASDVATPLAFATSGVASAGAVALRYRDRLELGGLIVLEQTGISYGSGQGIVGGLYSGGFGTSFCIAGVELNNGQIQPVVNGVAQASAGTLQANMLYEFRTMIFHPEPMRAGQVYASSISNGAGARTSQAWPGTAHVVLTMRTINPANAATTSAPQVAIYDGTIAQAPAYADYDPLWGTNLTCTLGHARATNHGAIWVQSAAPGQSWRTRIFGDVTAGAECYISSNQLRFTAASEPVLNEQIEVFYRTRGVACARVVSPQSEAALANSEGSGARAMVAHVLSPAPRTSLDCEQAALALLDDCTQAGYSGQLQSWRTALPQGAGDVQPGEQWNITAAAWGLNCSAIVRDVEIEFQQLADTNAVFTVRFANDSAQGLAIRYSRTKHNALIAVVTSNQGSNISARLASLSGARFTGWTASTISVDAGVAPVAGGGIEVRTEGDWGWGMATNRNLAGRFTSRTFTLPVTGVTQAFYLRQYDASNPPQYSIYATVLNLVV